MSSDLRAAARDRARRLSARSSQICGCVLFPPGSSDCAPRPRFAQPRREMRHCLSRPVPSFIQTPGSRLIHSFNKPLSISIIIQASAIFMEGASLRSGVCNFDATRVGLLKEGITWRLHISSRFWELGRENPFSKGFYPASRFCAFFVDIAIAAECDSGIRE